MNSFLPTEDTSNVQAKGFLGRGFVKAFSARRAKDDKNADSSKTELRRTRSHRDSVAFVSQRQMELGSTKKQELANESIPSPTSVKQVVNSSKKFRHRDSMEMVTRHALTHQTHPAKLAKSKSERLAGSSKNMNLQKTRSLRDGLMIELKSVSMKKMQMQHSNENAHCSTEQK